jgi:superfamily I DNA and/or RNA helicase
VSNIELVDPSPSQRLADRFGEHSSSIFSSIRLKTQYQSNRALVEWPNQVFYRGQIRTDSSVADICLANFLSLKKKPTSGESDDKAALVAQLIQKPLVFIDTDLVCEIKVAIIYSQINKKNYKL